jgi:hypothetical protein
MKTLIAKPAVIFYLLTRGKNGRREKKNEIKMFLENIITLQIFNPHYEHKFRLETEFLSENFSLFGFSSAAAFSLRNEKFFRMKNYSFHHDSFMQPNLHYVQMVETLFLCGTFSLFFCFITQKREKDGEETEKAITMKTWKSC